jgi:O-antigen ligase
MPLAANALVSTISRSGFLELGVGGMVFNLFSPGKWRIRVAVLSSIAIVSFFALTNPVYWERIGTIKQAGENVAGVDTGSGRLTLATAQLQMFEKYPLGCGHRCTAVLSPQYLPEEQLSGSEEGGVKARSSHNTLLTLLVEQGIPGALFYVAWLWWTIHYVRSGFRRIPKNTMLLTCVFPSIAGGLFAVMVGDMFVDYLKLEARIWLMALLMVITNLAMQPAAESGAPIINRVRPRTVS